MGADGEPLGEPLEEPLVDPLGAPLGQVEPDPATAPGALGAGKSGAEHKPVEGLDTSVHDFPPLSQACMHPMSAPK